MTKMEPVETAFEGQFIRIPAWIQSRGNCTYLILRAVRSPTDVLKAQRRNSPLATTKHETRSNVLPKRYLLSKPQELLQKV